MLAVLALGLVTACDDAPGGKADGGETVKIPTGVVEGRLIIDPVSAARSATPKGADRLRKPWHYYASGVRAVAPATGSP